MINKEIKANKIILYLIFSIISIIIMYEWLWADTSIFKTNQVIASISDLNNIYARGYQISNNDVYRDDESASIVVPFFDNFDRVSINTEIDNNIVDNVLLRLYFKNSSDGYSINNSIEIPADSNGNFQFYTKGAYGAIKLEFEGNYKESIKINNIVFSRDTMISSWSYYLKLTLGFLIIYLLIKIVLFKWIFKLDTFNRQNIFWTTIIIAESMFLLLNMVAQNYYFGSYLFHNATDSFMDHFNMLALLNNKDPYYLDASYPAMCFLLLKFMHVILPNDIQSIEQGLVLRNNVYAMFYFTILLVLCYFAANDVLKKCLDNNSQAKIIVLLFTGPFLYCVQRGNMLLIAFIALLVYYRYYDSESKKERYIAYVALAFSASIKIYPALFGLMTLKKKRYKETLLLAIIGFFMFILPFFAFDGINTLKEMLAGLSKAGEVMTSQGVGQNYSIENMRQIINTIWGFNIPKIQLINILAVVLLLLSAFVTAVDWEAWFLIATACVWYPDFSFAYILLLYYPALLAMLKDSKVKSYQYVLMGLMLSPLALPYIEWVDKYIDSDNLQMPMSYSTLIINIIIVLFTLSIIATIIVRKCLSMGIINNSLLLRRIGSFSVLLLIAIATIAVYNRDYNSKYDFKGHGTKWQPYEISSIEDIDYLRELVNNGEDFENAYFVQTKDIELDGKTSFLPIGWTEEGKKFSGVYDGQGHSIRNYYSLSENDERMGFFGTLDGELDNLSLENCNIGGSVVGGLAYEVSNNGKIRNCSVTGMLYGYSASGIVAYNSGLIENTASFVSINGTKIAGISKYNKGIVINSYSNIADMSSCTGVINEDTLESLNEHVINNNKIINRDITMSKWNISDGFLVISE